MACISMKPAMTSIIFCLVVERQFVTGRKKSLFRELAISAKKVLNTALSIQVALIWSCLLLLLKDKFPFTRLFSCVLLG